MGTALRNRIFWANLAAVALVGLVGRTWGVSWMGQAALAVAGAWCAAYLASRATRDEAQRLTFRVRRLSEGAGAGEAFRSSDADFRELETSVGAMASRFEKTVDHLRDERDLLEGILKGMQEGILLLDGAERVRMVNPALRDMLLLGADPVGKKFASAAMSRELEDILQKARGGENGVSAEIELVGIKPRRLLVRASSLSSEPKGVLAVFVDVTDVRRLEAIRRDFVANVSHELRTPVTAIRSAAETLREAPAMDPVATRRFLEMIERNAERLHLLVEDLLDLSRIESKEFRLTPETVDLAIELPYILSLFRERAEKKRIRLYTRLGNGTPPVRVDRRALEQVVSNLVDNAVKYCPPDSEVAVRAAVEKEAVVITVEDTGPGIEEKHLPRLFERFYRVDAGRSREVGGTGLGLSIVKHLVEAFGSTVHVRSAPGKGSAFYFSVPVDREASRDGLRRSERYLRASGEPRV